VRTANATGLVPRRGIDENRDRRRGARVGGASFGDSFSAGRSATASSSDDDVADGKTRTRRGLRPTTEMAPIRLDVVVVVGGANDSTTTLPLPVDDDD
jgi:lysophospholipase L1-like esterase